MDNKEPQVFVIEKDESLYKMLCNHFSESGIKILFFTNTEEAFDKFQNSEYPDLIVLDLDLAESDKFINQYRKKFGLKVYVLVISSLNYDENIVKALNAGADDFISKPFSLETFTAKIKAILRRNNFNCIKPEASIAFDDFKLLLDSCILKKGTKKIPLSTKEYNVLEYLAKNAGTILSPEQIYSDVWKVRYGDKTAVAVYIQRLRKKLMQNSKNKEYIRTVFGKGYIFDCDVSKND